MTYLRWGLIAGMLMLTGCTSLPSPSETSGGIMLMPVEVTTDSGGRFFYDYEFKVFDSETEEEVGRFLVSPTLGTKYETSSPMNPGSYYLGFVSSRPRQSETLRFSHNPSFSRTYVPFVIQEGAITMLPSYLMVHRYRRDGKSYTRHRVKDITADIQASTLSALEQAENSSLWRIILPIQQRNLLN